MKLVNYEATRATYAPFETIEQLNANTTAIRDQYAEIMITSEKAVLDVLHRYATMYYGVCYLAKSTIAEMVGLSRRQVIRICQKFEAMGIIRQYETDRKRGGGQTSNTIVFLTQVSARAAFVAESVTDADNKAVVTGDVTPVVTRLETPKDAPKELKTKRVTDDTDARAKIKDGLLRKLPQTFKHALAPFFDADEIYGLAGIVFKAKAAVDKMIQIEDYADEYYEAVIKAVNGLKRGQVRNFQAVLYSTIKATTLAIKTRNDFWEVFNIGREEKINLYV